MTKGCWFCQTHPEGELSTGDSERWLCFVWFVSFEDVQTHGVGGGVVEHEGEEIELQNGVKALGEFVEEAGELALLGDGFADFEKRFELPAGVFEAGGSLGEG